MWIPHFPTTCFSQPAYCLGMSVKILYRHLWIASQSSVIIFQWSVCAEHFVPFHTRSTAEGSILQGASRSSWGRFSKKRPETLSHSEPLENCNSGFSTYLFYFRYLFYTSFSPPSRLPFWHSFLSFICHPLSTDYWNWYNSGWDHFSLVLFLCVLSARRDSLS